MKKNVEVFAGGIECDNPKCDYVKEDVEVSDYHNWLNKPCPKCGENLLTQEDYDKIQIFMGLVDMFNEIEIEPDPDDIVATLHVDVHNDRMDIIDIESPYDQKKIDEKLRGRKNN